MKRRKFIKAGALFVPAYLAGISGIIRAGSAPSLNVAGTARVGTVSRPAGGGGGGSFTFVRKASNVSAPNANTQTVQLTSVASGNLIVVGGKSEAGTGITINGISDGTSSFQVSPLTTHANDDLRWVFGYLLSSVATGTVTYTITLSNSFPCCFTTFAFEFSYTGSLAFDTGNGGSGTSANVNSGNITTGASVALVLGSYGHYSGGTLTSIQIGGVAKDGSEPDTPGASQSAVWYRILSSVMTNGAATGSISSAEWVSRIISFTAT